MRFILVDRIVSIEPGKQGSFVKNVSQSEDYFSRGFIGYKFSEQFFSKIYLDYYSYKGWGYGIEEIYNVDSKMQGSVYGYHIWEHDTRIRRWNARIYHQQNFTDTWSTQVNSNLASDESFNNFYTRDWIRIYRDVKLFTIGAGTSQIQKNIIISEMVSEGEKLVTHIGRVGDFKGRFDPQLTIHPETPSLDLSMKG